MIIICSLLCIMLAFIPFTVPEDAIAGGGRTLNGMIEIALIGLGIVFGIMASPPKRQI